MSEANSAKTGIERIPIPFYTLVLISRENCFTLTMASHRK